MKAVINDLWTTLEARAKLGRDDDDDKVVAAEALLAEDRAERNEDLATIERMTVSRSRQRLRRAEMEEQLER